MNIRTTGTHFVTGQQGGMNSAFNGFSLSSVQSLSAKALILMGLAKPKYLKQADNDDIISAFTERILEVQNAAKDEGTVNLVGSVIRKEAEATLSSALTNIFPERKLIVKFLSGESQRNYESRYGQSHPLVSIGIESDGVTVISLAEQLLSIDVRKEAIAVFLAFEISKHIAAGFIETSTLAEQKHPNDVLINDIIANSKVELKSSLNIQPTKNQINEAASIVLVLHELEILAVGKNTEGRESTDLEFARIFKSILEADLFPPVSLKSLTEVYFEVPEETSLYSGSRIERLHGDFGLIEDVYGYIENNLREKRLSSLFSIQSEELEKENQSFRRATIAVRNILKSGGSTFAAAAVLINSLPNEAEKILTDCFTNDKDRELVGSYCTAIKKLRSLEQPLRLPNRVDEPNSFLQDLQDLIHQKIILESEALFDSSNESGEFKSDTLGSYAVDLTIMWFAELLEDVRAESNPIPLQDVHNYRNFIFLGFGPTLAKLDLGKLQLTLNHEFLRRRPPLYRHVQDEFRDPDLGGMSYQQTEDLLKMASQDIKTFVKKETGIDVKCDGLQKGYVPALFSRFREILEHLTPYISMYDSSADIPEIMKMLGQDEGFGRRISSQTGLLSLRVVIPGDLSNDELLKVSAAVSRYLNQHNEDKSAFEQVALSGSKGNAFYYRGSGSLNHINPGFNIPANKQASFRVIRESDISAYRLGMPSQGFTPAHYELRASDKLQYEMLRKEYWRLCGKDMIVDVLLNLDDNHVIENLILSMQKVGYRSSSVFRSELPFSELPASQIFEESYKHNFRPSNDPKAWIDLVFVKFENGDTFPIKMPYNATIEELELTLSYKFGLQQLAIYDFNTGKRIINDQDILVPGNIYEIKEIYSDGSTSDQMSDVRRMMGKSSPAAMIVRSNAYPDIVSWSDDDILALFNNSQLQGEDREKYLKDARSSDFLLREGRAVSLAPQEVFKIIFGGTTLENGNFQGYYDYWRFHVLNPFAVSNGFKNAEDLLKAIAVEMEELTLLLRGPSADYYQTFESFISVRYGLSKLLENNKVLSNADYNKRLIQFVSDKFSRIHFKVLSDSNASKNDPLSFEIPTFDSHIVSGLLWCIEDSGLKVKSGEIKFNEHAHNGAGKITLSNVASKDQYDSLVDRLRLLVVPKGREVITQSAIRGKLTFNVPMNQKRLLLSKIVEEVEMVQGVSVIGFNTFGEIEGHYPIQLDLTLGCASALGVYPTEDGNFSVEDIQKISMHVSRTIQEIEDRIHESNITLAPLQDKRFVHQPIKGMRFENKGDEIPTLRFELQN